MIGKLIEGIKKTGAPIVVGLDPQLRFIPENIIKRAVAEHGESLEAAGDAIFAFNRGIVDAVASLVPAVKPQIAMYEMFGLPGLAAFKKTIDYCHEKGLLVIGDVKRGDIGSTSGCYAQAHLGRVAVGGTVCTPFGEDFATVNPYLGSDGVKPFMEVCKSDNRGIFVLVKTSNPSSQEFQDRLIGETPLYELVGQKVREWGEEVCDESGWSEVGAVVGATFPEMGRILREVMPKSYILVPGYGAQGGKGKDLVPFFTKDGLGAIVNSSRGIIAAWQNEKYASCGADGYAEAARLAVIDMKKDIEEALG